MKTSLTLVAICLIQLISGFSVYAQEFELTPSISVRPYGNKSAVVIKKQSRNVPIGNVMSDGNILKSTTASQINFSWGKYFSTSYSDRLYKSVIDGDGNVIAVGSKGEGSSDTDAVIYKYDNTGKLLWSDTPALSPDWDAIYGVITDIDGNIYITGGFYRSAFNDKIYSNGDKDVFIAKYKPDGTLLWAKNAGGASEDYGSGIALDSAGNVYVVGFFNGTAYWGNISKTSSNQGDMFIAKYDNSGNAKWVRNGNIGENNYLYGIGADKSGNVYVSANFTGDAQFEGSLVQKSNGGKDIFLLKYDNLGNLKWLKAIGGAGDDGGNDTSVDNEGNILVAGYFRDNVIFESKTLTAHGAVDIFAAKYSSGGNLVWVKQFGGTGSQTAWTVTCDEKNNSYLSGWFSGTGAFDNTTIVSAGGSDAYLIKYDKNGNLIWVEQTATGVEKQVGSGVCVKENDIAIAGYYEGEMKIQNSIFPNSGGEDAYVAKLIQSDVQLPNIVINPKLTLSAIEIKKGQSITIVGSQFNPVGKVDLQFSGPSKLSPVVDKTIDVGGSFQYVLATPLAIEIGYYTVTATDKISGKTYSRSFRIISNQISVVDTYLKIIEPSSSKIRYIDESIRFEWQDKVKFNINTIYNYKHSYSISVQKDNGVWQILTKLEGINNGFGDLSLFVNFTPVQQGKYRLKVEDNYYPNRSVITPEIIIENPPTNDIVVEYIWDKSYPQTTSNSKPIGVAADGVARFYLVVSNLNPLNPAIQKVKVSLSDPDNYMAPRYLGKVKYCSIQNNISETPSLDANYVNSIEAENNSSNIDGKYWFWYVAPEDFARNKGDWDDGVRNITLNVEVTLADGKKYTKQSKVDIVRPPLFLVHGLNGDSKETWENFRIGANSSLYFEDKNRFKVAFAPQMEKTAAFDFNSNILLDGINNEKSFRYWINKLREMGYASNQVDYVCHSMGGSMLRNAIENTNLFYRNSNYKKGFVHKFITLNTPHQGSSLANLLDDISDLGALTSLITIPASFDKLAKLYEGFPPKIVDAVEDLKYKGGKKFGVAQVPSHLIGSGVTCREFNAKTLATYEYIKTILGTITLSSFLDQCTWFSLYFKLRGWENDFMDGNDAIVSLKSQFSGNLVGTLPSYSTRIFGTMHNSFFGESPTKSVDVFNKVDELLNSDVGSQLFSYLPSTIISAPKSANSLANNTVKVIENKISILYPATKLTYSAGDTMTIKLKVDTVGLKSLSLYFQDQSVYSLPSSPSVVVKLTVNPEQIEGQNIFVVGNYQSGGQASISTALKEIKVNPVGSIMEFSVKPEVIVLQKGKSTKPDYEAIFPGAISNIGITDLFSVVIKDPSFLIFNVAANSFTGLAAGITNANITYRGKSKTVFFEILEPVTPPVDPITDINDIRMAKKDKLNIKIYPNPVTNELTIELEGNTKKIDFEIINSLGQTILTEVVLESTVVQTTNFTPGIYLIKFKSGNTFEFRKIIKK